VLDRRSQLLDRLLGQLLAESEHHREQHSERL
jgi:hypothetical protein